MFDNMKRPQGDLPELQANRERLEAKIASNTQLLQHYRTPLWDWFANVFLKEEFRALTASFVTIPDENTKELNKLRGKLEYISDLLSRPKNLQSQNEKMMVDLSRTVRRIQELQRKQKET